MLQTQFYRFILSLLILGLASCASLPDNSHNEQSVAISPPDYISEATKLYLGDSPLPDSESTFMMIGEGLDAFVARMTIAERAQESIDITTFIFKDDIIGRSILIELLDAADRGVKVRLLLDDLWLGQRDEQFAAFDAHPNIEVRLFNPLKRALFQKTQYITRFGSVTRRMHNKAFIVDNQIAVIGGRNIGEEYFEAEKDVAFGDIDVITAGPVVHEISRSFDEFWNHQLAYPVNRLVKNMPSSEEIISIRQSIKDYVELQKDSEYAEALRSSSVVNSLQVEDLPFFSGQARVIADSPEKLVAHRTQTDLHMSGEMSTLFEASKQEVIIFTPYFIPQEEGAESLIELAQKGVRVRVLTNSISSNNHAAAHAYYAKYRERLLQGGVEIYEVYGTVNEQTGTENQTQVLHAKMFVFDRQYTFIGSLNLDPRSWIENTEIGAVFDSQEFGSEIGEWFDKEALTYAYRLKLKNEPNGGSAIVWIDSNGVEFDKEPDSSLWKTIKTKAYQWLPLESQM